MTSQSKAQLQSTSSHLSHSTSTTHDFSLIPACRIPTASSVAQNPLLPTLSQQTTVSVGDALPPTTAGNQIPPQERARILAERRGESPKPKGLARLFAAFKHPKTEKNEGNTFGKWTVSYGGGYQTSFEDYKQERRRNGVYGGLM